MNRPTDDVVPGKEPWEKIPRADVRVVTSDGRSIAVHAKFLVPESRVLEFVILDRPMKRDENVSIVPLLGVPYDAVVVFLRCLYSSSGRSPKKEEMDKYGVHLLSLSHALRVPWLKLAVTKDLVLTTNNVVDMLKLSRLCDTPALFIRSMNMIRRHFKAVAKTDGWKFIKGNDPRLELEVLEFLEESNKRDRQRQKMKKEQVVYTALSEAIECLNHICIEGCTVDQQPNANMNESKNIKIRPCRWGNTCQNLQQKIRHYADCETNKKQESVMVGDGNIDCTHCSRMWHLFHLHSAICDHTADICKVPLCSKFKMREGDENVNSKDWNFLVKKVASTAVFTRLSKRKMEESKLGRAMLRKRS